MKIVGSKQNLIGEYDNGNYHVMIYDDGTKIRYTDDDKFMPDFPECIDMMVTYKCDGNCQYCYINGNVNGSHCDFNLYKPFLDSIRPYTELAINGNDLSHSQMYEFLEYMKNRHVIVNLTVNQIHFEKHLELIKDLIDRGLIHGLGVSLVDLSDSFIDKVRSIKNVVIHIIAGITSPIDISKLRNKNLNILILGYKNIGKGRYYYNSNHKYIDQTLIYIRDNLRFILEGFNVVSFDNLALNQLNVRNYLPEKEFESIYMGDDGDFTFYADLVKGTFSKSSLEIYNKENTHELSKTMTVDDCFKIIREENLV